MMRTTTIRSTIRSQLMQQGPCTFETLVDRLPQFSWNEIFTTVDQLSRAGELTLRRQTRFDYEVSIGLMRPVSDRTLDGGGAESRASEPAEQCVTL